MDEGSERMRELLLAKGIQPMTPQRLLDWTKALALMEQYEYPPEWLELVRTVDLGGHYFELATATSEVGESVLLLGPSAMSSILREDEHAAKCIETALFPVGLCGFGGGHFYCVDARRAEPRCSFACVSLEPNSKEHLAEEAGFVTALAPTLFDFFHGAQHGGFSGFAP